MSNGIDFVIIWVDGGDPVWRKEKDHWLTVETGKEPDASDNRYRDWENLKYWFRAVEKYAPWVNKVHFVTCGQHPEWMNLNAPKLHVVDHKDFIPAEYLPTFSSHPIELNLHRIEGLSDRFVYFNDDFFLTAPVKETDFFRNGLPCDCMEEQPFGFVTNEPYNSICVNDVIFCNRHFDRAECMRRTWRKWFSLRGSRRGLLQNLLLATLPKQPFFGIQLHHVPQAYLKSTLEKVWELEPEWLHETCTHRFRSTADVSQCVFEFYQLLTGTYSPYRKLKNALFFKISDQIDKVCSMIERQQYKMICLNDSGVEDFEGSKARLNATFERMLPEKSSFEK